ncbi:response regulator transcription factor [Serratia marcescens]|uniref:LuxR C-terminal-related transcriptional regulator n=1 Tax=Serratia sarumanii TaxID=3020826 RepID=A0ABW8QTK9_9GAMM|nr:MULTISPECIES: response regulator transcription factor [Serratia]EGS9996960.1 response regulator transcription factor [Serratia marcescens]ELJ5772314.1 response regulator transcription factor [Serratia marcescens]ELJ5816370.1 response regulator transcription factor [Serratia marcescens]ELN8909210.1 response regulator transcription factor [Serratia marcescens]ELT0475070.1 response regulator transcription factor [Serratia marcescens]
MNINYPYGTTLAAGNVATGAVAIMEPCPLTALGMRNRLIESCGLPPDKVRQVTNLVALRALFTQHAHRLLVMDLCGKSELVLDGFRLIADVRESSPDTAIIICTALDEPRLLRQLIASGIRGLMLKQEPAIALTHCVQQVLAGCSSFSHRVRQRQLHEATADKPLTAKELDVLTQLFSGKSVTSVALTMCRDIRTVSTHKRNAMLKLGFHSDGELYLQGKWMAAQGSSFVR